jgi:small-conductance mechanosensitive channel/CRP-like cAMP-binding protein
MTTNAVPDSAAEALAGKLEQLASPAFLHAATPRLLAAALVYLFLVVLLRLGRNRGLGRVAVPLNLLGLACILRLFLGDTLGTLFPAIPRLLTASVVFFLAVLLLRAAELILFEFFFVRSGRKPVPVVLRDIGRALLTALLFVLIVKGFFPALNFNVLAVSSIIVGYVVGNATQDTLGNLVAGLALNSENSFSIGDWIAVGDRIGKVTDITWRSTRMLTKNMEDIIVPNSTLSKEILVNFSRPTPELRTRLQVGVSYDTPPNLVREVLLGAIRDVPGIDPVPLPKVRVVSYADSAVLYDIFFYVHDFEKIDDIRADVMNLIWYRLKRANISIPYPVRDVRARQITREDDAAAERERQLAIARLFATNSLFAPLSAEERLALAAACQVRIYAAGEEIVRQGDAGASMFVIESGAVGIFVDQKDRARVRVGALDAGHFFGERSLLTGEGRSATVAATSDTVVAELGKEAFASILKAKPDMAEYLGRVLAERDQARETLAAGAGAAGAVESQHQKGRQFMTRILNFFGVS